MQTIRSIIRFVLGAIVLLWLLTFMLPRIPAVQTFLGEKVSTLLAETLGTKVSVGRIDLQMPSRIIVDELQVADQQGRDMLRVGRVAVSVDILPLLDGKIRLSSAQLFGLRAHITQRDVKQLRKLIQAVFPDKLSALQQVLFRILQLMRRYIMRG